MASPKDCSSAATSRLPDPVFYETITPMSCSFTKHLVQLNRLEEQGFQHWSWRPGMLFAADRTWWGAEAARPRPHEGLDLSLFAKAGGGFGSLAAGTMIPVLFAGQVVAVFADFLGHSILVAHPFQQGGGRFHSLYAHVMTEPGIEVGHRCRAGEIIARMAPSPRPGIPAHLHLTTCWLTGVAPEATDWDWSMINDSAQIRLSDPLEFLDLCGQDIER